MNHRYERDFPTCANIECTNPVENADTGLCASCGRAQRKLESDSLKEANKKAQRKQVKKVSDKMALALKQYMKVRKTFLELNPKCAVYPSQKATDVHHQKGRATIELLLNRDYWLPVSREGHNWIHANPKEAIERGFSFSRLTEEPHKI